MCLLNYNKNNKKYKHLTYAEQDKRMRNYAFFVLIYI